MKYTFQDSTEFPLRRDIIQDIQEFVDTSTNVLPIENASIEENDEFYKARSSLEKNINEIANIHKNVQDHVLSLTETSEAKEILDYSNYVFDACDDAFNKSVESMRSEVDNINARIEEINDDFGHQILSALNPLFAGGIYGTSETFSATMVNNSLQGKLSSSIVGMEYESSLTFKDSFLTIRGIYGPLFLPFWTRSGLIHKEDKVKLDPVSDFVLSSVEFDVYSINASFEHRKLNRRFKVEMDDESLLLFYDGNEVTADPVLMQSLNMDDIASLMNALREYIHSNITNCTLVKLSLDGDDAIRNNQIFDCLKLIAEQYTDIIKDCLDKGYVKGEITIKIESDDNIRTEKYVHQDELFDRLSELGSEGLELASILGVDNK